MLFAASFLKGVLILLTLAAIVLWLSWRALRKSKDSTDLLVRWGLTAGVLVAAWKTINPVAADGSTLGKLSALVMGLAFSVPLIIIWVPHIAGTVGDWFAGIYTGGNEEAEPQPFYSVAQSLRKQGKFREAIYELREQLARFPDDVKGHLMIAEIQAENLSDLPGAQTTIERFCQPGRPPAHLSYALTTLADWHLKLTLDTESARQALEKIQELLPDTEQAMMAAQRLAHLATPEMLQAAQEHQPIHLTAHPKDAGLHEPPPTRPRAEEDPAVTAQKLIQQLEQHPLDCEAREKLAVLYSEHFDRLDLAAGELDQLIATPHQPPKEVVRWLNLLADFQVRHGVGYDGVKVTLERIIDGFPGVAAAQMAQQRLAHLRLELKGKEKSQAVKLGSYEKDLGLKRRREN